MIKVDNLLLKPSYTEQDLRNLLAKNLKISVQNIDSVKIIRKSIDARKKPNVKYVLSVGVTLKNDLENKFKNLTYTIDNSLLSYEKKSINYRPVVVGFGPAGMFCALTLSKMGLKPIVIEQGKMVEERAKDVNAFWEERKLNKYSNVQFGEGGAGTFSDGKLNTNLNNMYCKKVLNEFYHFGADKEILYNAKPHVGSDKLKDIVKNLREEIISLGGEILFSHKLVGIGFLEDSSKKLMIKNVKTEEKTTIVTQALFLALGHSARDTFRLLQQLGFEIHQKPFAMGVRIEQKQEDINVSQYGENYDRSLPPADYKLVTHLKSGRSVFTFCMCPGGQVVASSSNEGEIVTNGMSNFKRDDINANSALLVNVLPSDYESVDPLSGIKFQEKYEKLAFNLAGNNYNAPAQTVGNFLGRNTKSDYINPTYKPNVAFVDIKKCLPDFVVNSLKEALPELNKKLKNFAKDENLLIGVESRSSCPLTIIRDESFEAINNKGVYPIGEGAGYAGGIVSSAVDGIKAGESFYSTL